MITYPNKSNMLKMIPMKWIYPFHWITLRAGFSLRKMASFLLKVILYESKKSRKSSVKAYQLVHSGMLTEQINPQIAWAMKRAGVDVPSSLSAALISRHEHNMGLVYPESYIDNKLIGRKFAHLLGFRMPDLLFEQTSYKNIQLVEKTVIKPVNAYSAHGVFIVHKPDHTIELRSGKVFRSRESLAGYMCSLLDKKLVPADEWTVEKYICKENKQPANDVKFYVFYGRFAWFSEIQRYPESRHYMLDNKGAKIDYGLYPKQSYFVGEGVSEEEVKMVEEASLEIPAPFIRIDFLRGTDGLYFGEFTPRSGVIGYLPRSMDSRFGKWYHEASSRLRGDLLSGKSFEKYHKLVKE